MDKFNKRNNLSVVLIMFSMIAVSSYAVLWEGNSLFHIIVVVVMSLIIFLSALAIRVPERAPSRSEKLHDFHTAFNYESGKFPQPLPMAKLSIRNKFIVEEIVEAIYGTVKHDDKEFHDEVDKFISTIKEVRDETIEKNVNADKPVSPLDVLIEQTDGLIDAEYFIQGTFDMMGVDTDPIFDIVHDANMNKLGSDGKPIIRESDGKIQKPKGWVAPEPLIKEELKYQINKTKLDDLIG